MGASSSFLNWMPAMPPSMLKLKSNISGWVFVDKHMGADQDFLLAPSLKWYKNCILSLSNLNFEWSSYPSLNLNGIGSTNNPDQLYFSSSRRVLEPSKKSSAPASTKNPSWTLPLNIFSRNKSCLYWLLLMWAGTYLLGKSANKWRE